jgi:hypothetical protein
MLRDSRQESRMRQEDWRQKNVKGSLQRRGESRMLDSPKNMKSVNPSITTRQDPKPPVAALRA